MEQFRLLELRFLVKPGAECGGIPTVFSFRTTELTHLRSVAVAFSFGKVLNRQPIMLERWERSSAICSYARNALQGHAGSSNGFLFDDGAGNLVNSGIYAVSTTNVRMVLNGTDRLDVTSARSTFSNSVVDQLLSGVSDPTTSDFASGFGGWWSTQPVMKFGTGEMLAARCSSLPR